MVMIDLLRLAVIWLQKFEPLYFEQLDCWIPDEVKWRDDNFIADIASGHSLAVKMAPASTRGHIYIGWAEEVSCLIFLR
jgi:hypothetical protein